MRILLLIVLEFIFIVAGQSAYAFDQHTHAAMTSEAIASSAFTRDPNASPLLKRLGLFDFTPAFGDQYPDVVGLGRRYVDLGSIVRGRRGLAFEASIIDALSNTPVTQLTIPDQFTITGWFMRGAIREDDNREETPAPIGDEPDGVFNRVFGHFFDSQLNRGLTVAGIQVGARAVDWALQPGATVTDLPASFGTRQNHFKISDAREAMWRALTLKTATMGEEVFPFGWGNGAEERESLRKAYWATTFRALGDVVHLLQDMGQPQHTRNDAHSGVGCLPGMGCAFGHDSYFEKHLRERTRGQKIVSIKEGLFGPANETRIDIVPTQLVYQGYAKPLFTNFNDYFATAVAGGNASGNGLANYSNRGFYSFGTNIGTANAAQYPSPNPTGSGLGYTIISEPELEDSAKRPISGSVVFRIGPVVDTVTGTSEQNVKLAAIGAWDQFLQQKNSTWGSYTLNYYNYDDQAKLLVPRAVGYSAGLIDYFFRGQLYVAPPAESVFALVDHGDPASNCKDTCGFKKIKLRVANSTPDITPPGGTATAQGMTGGKIVAVAKFRRNSCYTPNLNGEYHGSGGDAEKIDYYNGCVAPQPEEIVVSDALNVAGIPPCNGNCNAAAVPYTFNFQSPIPINAASLALQLVYRGVLGSESDAVVVQTVDVSEPSFYIYMNASDYIKIGTSVYTRERINSDPAQPDGRPSAASLRQSFMPQSCIVNDQLISTCPQIQPYNVSFALRWGDPAPATFVAPLALATPKLFSRFAMITAPDQPAVVNQSATPCFPTVPSVFPGRETQERYVQVPSSNPPTYQPINAVSPMILARGVYTTYGVACVTVGDGIATVTQDDRYTVMTALVGSELTPKPVSGFTFGD